MKTPLTSETVKIPEGITAQVDSRRVTITGPRGTLSRTFRHLQADITLVSKKTIKAEKWFGKHKEMAVAQTVCRHTKSMIKGVTKGYFYKMKSVYAHFTIYVAILENGGACEVRDFLGEKFTRHVDMMPGVKLPADNKDENLLEENYIELVLKSTTLIQQSTYVKYKDIRRFMDVSMCLRKLLSCKIKLCDVRGLAIL